MFIVQFHTDYAAVSCCFLLLQHPVLLFHQALAGAAIGTQIPVCKEHRRLISMEPLASILTWHGLI